MRAALALIGAAVVGLVTTELVMHPAMGTRLQISSFLAGTALVALVAAWWFPRWAQHARRLEMKVFALALVSVLVVAGAVTAATGLMVISGPDLHLLWIVVGFALTIGIIFASSVARPLTEDLRQIAATARLVGAGDLTVRTSVDRSDEVGVVARALDDTTARLEQMEADRRRERVARRGLLTAIGHDLRTPLAALRAAVEALQDGVVADTDRYLRAMEADIGALTVLVDDLFVLTRIESDQLDLKVDPVDLADIADETLEALRPVADGRGIELILETPGHVRALGDSAELSRVIRNLVDNAIRHSPTPGRVVVEVEENGTARLRVTDEGPGFRPEFVRRAFESFSRDDDARVRTGGGSGLGLAIAHGIVTAHGGRIWAVAGPGGLVGFEIPVAAGAQG